jgi:hypothetical protein
MFFLLMDVRIGKPGATIYNEGFKWNIMADNHS